jgi:hypothetical protein
VTNPRRSIRIIRFTGLLAALATAVVPATASGTPTRQAGAAQVEFRGLFTPAGAPGTGTTCPYTVNAYGWCVIDNGQWTHLPNGRLRIRNMVTLERSVAWHADGSPEPRKTGFDTTVVNADVDQTFNGSTWGTCTFHPDMGGAFDGSYSGEIKNAVPAVRFILRGSGIYEGQRMSGQIGVAIQPWGGNMFGRILKSGHGA